MCHPLMIVAAVLAIAGLSSPQWNGVWRNESDSVHIRISSCGEAVCGTVIWASAKAKADVARRGRTLIGAQLFREFRPGDDGMWHGQVYVPDIDRTFTGTITMTDSDTLTGTGCLVRKLGCRTQTWKRVR